MIPDSPKSKKPTAKSSPSKQLKEATTIEIDKKALKPNKILGKRTKK